MQGNDPLTGLTRSTTAPRPTGVAVAVVTLVLPAFVGCITSAPDTPGDGLPQGTPPPQACGDVEVPALRQGASYTWGAEGKYYESTRWVNTDWSATNPGSDRSGPIVLPEGSGLTIRVADEPEPMLTYHGDHVPAVQATYWFDHADEPNPNPAFDVWVDPDTGNLVQWTWRTEAATKGDIFHGSRFLARSRPPLLFGSLFWNATLGPDDSGRHAWREGPYNSDWSHQGQEWINWTVERVRPAKDREACLAEVEAEVGLRPGTQLGVADLSLTLASDRAMPIAYTWDHPDVWAEFYDEPQPTFRLRLEDATRGSGPSLAAFRDTLPGDDTVEDLDATRLPMRPPRNGSNYHGADIFTTDYDRAVRKAKATEDGQVWFGNHPDARPAYLEHLKGNESSENIDYWNIFWTEPEGRDTFQAMVTRKEPLLPGLDDRFEVHTRRSQQDWNLAPLEDWTTMGGFEQAFESYYEGEQLEVLSCDFRLGEGGVDCDGGSQNSTGRHGIGGWAGVRPFTIWIRTGWIFNDPGWTVGEEPFGPPVR